MAAYNSFVRVQKEFKEIILCKEVHLINFIFNYYTFSYFSFKIWELLSSLLMKI